MHKEDISEDARKNRQSFNKDITDDSHNNFQDKSKEEIKKNLVTGNAINHVPYRPLPSYPPEVFVNSDAVEFGFVPIKELSQTTSRPLPNTQIQNYSADDKSNENLRKPAVDAQNK